MADFVGETTLGTWTLSIVDDGPASVGSLQRWTLHTSVDEGWDCAPWACSEPAPGEPVDLVRRGLRGGAGRPGGGPGAAGGRGGGGRASDGRGAGRGGAPIALPDGIDVWGKLRLSQGA